MQTTKTSSISLEIILNTFDSMLKISLSTQILILTIVSLLFILVSILCDLLCCQMCTFYCPPKKMRCSSSWGGRCIHLAAHSSKRLHLLSVTKLVCLGNTQENKTTSSLVLLAWNFNRYWWLWPISSITSSNIIYTQRINNTTQKRNSTVLWWLLWYQVTLYNSNISINNSEQSFPN